MNDEALYNHTDMLSRRAFLVGAGLAAGAAAATSLPVKAYAEETVKTATQAAIEKRIFEGQEIAIGHILHDPDKCAGCRTCELACSLHKTGSVNPELSNIRIKTDWFGGYISEAFICKQCAGAECVAVCPTGAAFIDESTGARMINAEKCVGCMVCMEACPARPSNIHFDQKMQACQKCDLCGGEPACVAHCPAEALSCSWVEVKDDSHIVTDSGIVVEIALTGTVLSIAKDAVTVDKVDAIRTSGGVRVTGSVNSTYTQAFFMNIKASFSNSEGESLFASDEQHTEMQPDSSQDFEVLFPTSDPNNVAAVKLEVMCGKVGGTRND